MPRVVSYSPAWLSRPSPGFHLFDPQTQNPSSRQTNGYKARIEYLGPNRNIAQRDTEVFVVSGKQIRWADLPTLKDQWQAMQETPSKKAKVKGHAIDDDEELALENGSYRALKAGIGEPIRQLCISPNKKLMAIVTSHTVHIAILPQPELLNVQHNKEPLKLKTYMIGPTTHVLSQSSLASVLWHPLGEGGNCLVTITTDAVLRLWEFDTDNRWSADSPALAIDLKKLVAANSEQDDVGANRSNRNKTFTPDAAGMDVASACFGGAGYGDETPWSAITLWIAMSSADVYALCPLLPTKFQPPSDLLPLLSTTIIGKKASTDGESQHVPDNDCQLQWIHDLDNQEPLVQECDEGGEPVIVEIYKRPSGVSAIPRLQGPFQLFPEDTEDCLELSDIYVIPGKADADTSEAIEDSETDTDSQTERADDEGISASLVCLMTREGRVYVCLDLEGVEGQWLPQKASSKPSLVPQDPYLVVLEGLDTLRAGEASPEEWPTFTQDVESRYSFFTTHSHGVYYFSFSPWLQNLGKELQNEDPTGVQFRLNMFRNNINTIRERILSFNPLMEAEEPPSVPACLAMQDSDLGYFIFTTFDSQPQAANIELPYPSPLPPNANEADWPPDIETLIPSLAYPPYQPSPAFYARSALPTFTDKHVPSRHKHLVKNEIRLSPATLDIMTEAHRVLSKETNQLGHAAADLFRRCEQLLKVLRNQILKAGEVAEKVDAVTSVSGEGEGKNINEAMEERIDRARERQGKLSQRCQELRRRVREYESRDLSLREQEWVREIESVSSKVLGRRREGADAAEKEDKEEGSNEHDNDAEELEEEQAEHLKRFKQVQQFAQDLVQQAKDMTTETESSLDKEKEDRAQSPVPSALRKRKMMEIEKLLERETTLVDATQAKLEQLTLTALQ